MIIIKIFCELIFVSTDKASNLFNSKDIQKVAEKFEFRTNK